MPELELPDLSNTTLLATLDTWLRPAFAGKTRLDALDEAAFEQAVKSLLSWTQHALIDRHVPAHIIVPSGMGRHIDYGLADDGTPQPPVLSVKLQELFGLPDTPHIAKPYPSHPTPTLTWRAPTASDSGFKEFLD